MTPCECGDDIEPLNLPDGEYEEVCTNCLGIIKYTISKGIIVERNN